MGELSAQAAVRWVNAGPLIVIIQCRNVATLNLAAPPLAAIISHMRLNFRALVE